MNLVFGKTLTRAGKRHLRRRLAEMAAWGTVILAAGVILFGIVSFTNYAAAAPKGTNKVIGIKGEPITIVDCQEKEEEQGITLSEDEKYLLAKIAMAEAEGEDTEGKALVMRVVINRMEAAGFSDSIEGVIFQSSERDGRTTYQFSVVAPGGRWWRAEPDEDCFQAVDLILEGWDESEGATYFESAKASENSWHARALQYLFTAGGHKFYKEKA